MGMAESETDFILTRDQVALLCSECAEHMDFFRMKQLNLKQLSPEQIKGLCERFGGEEGFHKRCTESEGIQRAFSEPDRFCAWLKDQCHPGWRELSEKMEEHSEKRAIGSHSTNVVSRRWDAAAVERGISSGASAADLRSVYAWRDPDGEPTAKGSYKFPHHHGVGGAANVTALRAGIAALNGARGGADIPSGDRRGVWNHLAKHLRDAEVEPPALRSMQTNAPEWVQKNTGVMVGLWPDATTAQALALNRATSAPPEDLHLTLAFLGTTDMLSEEALQALPHLVKEWAALAFPIEGRVSGLGRFTTGGDVHPFYASVDIPGIHNIRDSLVSYLHISGIPVSSDFEFSPHITLEFLLASDPDPIEQVHPHPLRFEGVTLAIGEERLVYPLGQMDEGTELSVVGGPFFASVDKTEAEKEHDGTEHIAYAAVLVPGEPDSDGEVLNAPDIERVAHLWLERYKNIDLQHTLNNVGVVPVESYITVVPMNVKVGGQETVLPQGTWVMAGKARDENIWQGIKSGELAGYSVMAVPGIALKEASVKSEAARKERTLIRDLGPGWIVPFVSVVDRPAVPKARWFAFKSALEGKADDLLVSEKELDDMIAIAPDEAQGWLKSVLKEGRRFSGATYRQLKAAVEALTALIAEAEAERGKKAQEDEMTEQEIRDLVQTTVGETVKAEVAEAVKSALGEKPLAEQIADAVKAATPEPDPKGEGAGAGEGAGDQGGKGDESEAEKALREENEALKAKVTEGNALREEMEKRLSKPPAKSRSLPGQDGGVETGKAAVEDALTTSYGLKFRRDGFGRSVPVK